ncbi:helix-turn-helix domain-containing protein [Rubrivirga marina]|uniref:Helix-turn-helix domain-containing protein n=1 Tax=Rubrivirga marina TaxID=1196024 RepID=A0A271IZE4_9BACT|nr:helix-turn-helix domain-containing protein [Rubrivirga marina]PAP76358.1 hypothetical protein BSZ37_07825 [Rubrivirga marina]
MSPSASPPLGALRQPTTSLGSLVLADPDALDSFIRAAVAEAVSAVIESHAAEVRALRESLFAAKGLLTAHEAGEVLGGVSAETVMAYVKDLGLPCYRPGRRPLFRLGEINEWVGLFPDREGSGG